MYNVSNNPDLYNLLNYYEQGNFQKVILKCKELIISGYKSYILHSLMGASYDAIDFNNEAILSYKKSLKLNNKFFETHFNVGNIYLKKMDFVNAIKHFKKFICFK